LNHVLHISTVDPSHVQWLILMAAYSHVRDCPDSQIKSLSSAGNVPPKANLGDLRGLAGGLDAGGSVMIDGEAFDGAKAYKDSKVRPQ
jgi:hypothetical protein